MLPTAVSYTHLDVYKRQKIWRVLLTFLFKTLVSVTKVPLSKALRTVINNLFKSGGLEIKSNAPFLLASIAVSTVPCPEIIIKGRSGFRMSAFSSTSIPVSYTHLDVYKRQVLYTRKFIRKGKFETGLTPLLYTISKKSSKVEPHNIYSQIITAALTVGFGGSTGLEAPIVTSGASIGSSVGLSLIHI